MYRYEDLRPRLFTDEGQRMFLKIRDRTKKLLAASGAVRMDQAINCVSGDSWTMLACVDRMVELNEIREITLPGTIGQSRVFVEC